MEIGSFFEQKLDKFEAQHLKAQDFTENESSRNVFSFKKSIVVLCFHCRPVIRKL